jgi:Glycosyl transferase family 2
MQPVADLSIFMPTYNHARYLRRALDAILSQSVQPKEFIVIDDCSTDETPAILEQYARNHALLQVYRNERNQGVNATARRALDMATSAYVYFPASDDYVLPGFIEKTVAILDRYPEAGLGYSYFSIRNELTGEIAINASLLCDKPTYFSPEKVEEKAARRGIAGHTAILKREFVFAAGGYLPDLEWHSDWFLSLVVAFRHGICHVPEALALLSTMPGTYSTGAREPERQKRVLNALLDRLLSPQYRDIGPAIQRSGCMAHFGTALIQAAAERPDAWRPEILGFLHCLERAKYEQLAGDADPRVRKLAEHFLGSRASAVVTLPKWQIRERDEQIEQQSAYIKQLEDQCSKQHQVVVELCERIQNLDSSLEKANHHIAHLEGTLFFRVRAFLARCKRAALRLLRPARTTGS